MTLSDASSKRKSTEIPDARPGLGSAQRQFPAQLPDPSSSCGRFQGVVRGKAGDSDENVGGDSNIHHDPKSPRVEHDVGWWQL